MAEVFLEKLGDGGPNSGSESSSSRRAPGQEELEEAGRD